LGYFGGIGAASRKGILIKGSNYLDALTQVRLVVFDKTGTLTKGEFKVSKVVPVNGFTEESVLNYAAQAEAHSNHPIARSIIEASGSKSISNSAEKAQELAGQGVMANIHGKSIIAGNATLMRNENIIFNEVKAGGGTVVYVSVDKVYAGHINISDTLKEDAAEAIETLTAQNIQTIILTGDNYSSAEAIAEKLKIDNFYSDLLPEDKVNLIEKLMADSKHSKVAFVGDGINDAPVLARADVGIAMGALGSDAAIETADVVLMSDSPSAVVSVIQIAKKTRTIVWQNIIFALGVKLFFIIMGVAGIATMWEAVFGDMGVALIAVFNAMRIIRSK
jgi:Zn2+/Cd2+-exporting ATPase